MRLHLGKSTCVAVGAMLMIAASGMNAGLAAQDADGVWNVSSLSSPPRVASPASAQRAIQNSYTRFLQEAGISGKVVLEFVVDTKGTVEPATIHVIQSANDKLTDAAKMALGQIKFVPGMADGHNVRTRVQFPIVYVSQ